MVYRYLNQVVELKVYDRDEKSTASLPEARGFEEVASSDIVILSVPISEVEAVCRELLPFVRDGQIFVDTCSVKTKPLAMMEKLFPEGAQIIGTHPLFGPDSGKDGIAGFKIVVCPVRIEEPVYQGVIGFLQDLDLIVVESTPEEHDRQIAQTQAIFHLIAQAMKDLGWGVKAISTPGPDTFYRLVKTVQQDTSQLFQDMAKENPYAAEYRKKFMDTLGELDQSLKQKEKTCP
jgi:prephenate dehydrogenase